MKLERIFVVPFGPRGIGGSAGRTISRVLLEGAGGVGSGLLTATTNGAAGAGLSCSGFGFGSGFDLASAFGFGGGPPSVTRSLLESAIMRTDAVGGSSW